MQNMQIPFMGKIFSFPIPRLPFSYVSLRKVSSTGDPIEGRDLYPPLMEQGTYEQAKSPLWQIVLDIGRQITETRTSSKEETLRLGNEEFKELGHKCIETMLEYFHTIDINEDGLIDYKEMCQALNTIGDNSSEDERKNLFKETDTDHSGAIDFLEFVHLFHRLTDEDKRASGKMRQIFRSVAEISSDVTNLQRIRCLRPDRRFQFGFY
ncbi:Troponin C, isoform 3 [Oopsacas minuta]|uniref:Troponin C, isoform 3 n=1 Tax=Oopsacas minuta TaxID=111878 RepID=A0AAV7JNF2_9METZ|nr:Troponin C, isoform 3 [Oopsacas minuta]